jgi:hypothetical protein
MRLLALARRQLDAGESQAALESLQRAAMMRHAADSELGIVRALMAAGRYRHALAACAHTAGAHREEPAGLGLYAWLLRVGGQRDLSLRLLDDALRLAPANPILRATRERLSSDWPLDDGLFADGPALAAAPPAVGATADDRAPPGTGAVATALLLPGGGQALLVRAAAPDAGRLWLRNGLGQTMLVAERHELPDPALDLLTLRTPMPSPAWHAAVREPFAGAAGSLVEYAVDPDGRAAWPLLRQGFFAGVPHGATSRPLGLEAPPGPRGGPVFDAAARFVGVAAGGAIDKIIGLQRLRAALGDSLPPPAADSGAAPVGLDAVYERALPGTLQVLV